MGAYRTDTTQTRRRDDALRAIYGRPRLPASKRVLLGSAGSRTDRRT
jgi:hypothetical protein